MNEEQPFLKRPAHFYPVWSNFLFFIAGLYAICIIPQIHRHGLGLKFLFAFYGVLIILTGAFSVVYHVHTPSWTGRKELHDDFHQWLTVDQGFALTITIYGALLLVIAIYLQSNVLHWQFFLYEPTVWFSALFVILSVLFYLLGIKSTRDAEECEMRDPETGICYRRHIDGYDIFHSNWHIFTGLTLIFWLTMIVRILREGLPKKHLYPSVPKKHLKKTF